MVLIICRLCNPSSELHIAEHSYKSTALPELRGVPDDTIYDERLYRALEKLHASCENRTWKKEVIDRRVGKIMAKNSRAAGLYNVTVKDVSGRAAIS